ncbi:hypothetical protein CK203_014316 [Vitis vinifera]|uniref:Reverse transcriptase Ty1/copia-type domain-containing protein n=1 Tax=Vitis vinifera TaxID=29760 RepID=A0A438K581_VITVI|nr:hypothetical protein CK203_014316 [Vitis vinifera]
MHSEFEMSMMGELNFFLGLQIKQLKEGTFINQAKYIRDLLKRFNMEEAKTMKTPMSSSIKLDMDEKGLWYPKGDNFELIGFSDADLPVRHFGDLDRLRLGLILDDLRLGFDLNRFHLERSLCRASGERRHFRAQGKRPAEPSQPEQTEARRKARYDTTSSVRETIRYKQNLPEESRSREKYQFLPTSALRFEGLSSDGMAASVTISEPIFRLWCGFYSRDLWLGGPYFHCRGVEIS